MARIVIEGGQPLRGEVTVLGAKNVGFKMMIASLLGEGISTINNLPHVADVFLVKEIIESLGGKVTIENHTATIDPSGVDSNRIPMRLGEKARASTMFIPVLLHLFGEAQAPYPGGDKIGRRPIDRHLHGLQALGAKIETKENHVLAKGKLQGADYHFSKITHTGTETLILAAVKAKGITKLENVAIEPEVDNLIAFLNQMGAKIQRQHRLIRIEGVTKLAGTEFTVMPDQNEVVTFTCMALATKGDITIKNAEKDHLVSFLEKVTDIGGQYEFTGSDFHVWWEEPLRAATLVTSPYPGFKTDWQPVWTALMTQVEGESVVHEAVFENRFTYVPLLNQMGARIELFNHDIPNPEEFYNFNLEDDRPEYFHAAKIYGPTALHSGEYSVPDIRAGATLTLAALVAHGQTILTDVEHIHRGYEHLVERLQGLGAKVGKDE